MYSSSQAYLQTDDARDLLIADTFQLFQTLPTGEVPYLHTCTDVFQASLVRLRACVCAVANIAKHCTDMHAS